MLCFVIVQLFIKCMAGQALVDGLQDGVLEEVDDLAELPLGILDLLRVVLRWNPLSNMLLV